MGFTLRQARALLDPSEMALFEETRGAVSSRLDAEALAVRIGQARERRDHHRARYRMLALEPSFEPDVPRSVRAGACRRAADAAALLEHVVACLEHQRDARRLAARSRGQPVRPHGPASKRPMSVEPAVDRHPTPPCTMPRERPC